MLAEHYNCDVQSHYVVQPLRFPDVQAYSKLDGIVVKVVPWRRDSHARARKSLLSSAPRPVTDGRNLNWRLGKIRQSLPPRGQNWP